MDEHILKTDETIPPRIKDERLGHVVRQLNREFQTSLESRLLPCGVNFGFLAYLRALWEEEGSSQIDLSERVGLSGPTTHSVIKRMEAAGLVELRPMVEGKPRRAVFLSEQGRNIRKTLEPMAEEVNAVAVAGLTEEEKVQLRELLIKLYLNLQEDDVKNSK
jgi:MarR family transcriptional regulator, organic hydroperoxide resistance regulator